MITVTNSNRMAPSNKARASGSRWIKKSATLNGRIRLIMRARSFGFFVNAALFPTRRGKRLLSAMNVPERKLAAAIAARLDAARLRGLWHPRRNDVDAELAALRMEAAE